MTLLITLLVLPRNAGILLLTLYRATVSQQSGLIVGSALAAARIVRCNPWSRGGVDDPPRMLRSAYRITPLGFVGPATQGA